jgi:LEA14-like dessication related protein
MNGLISSFLERYVALALTIFLAGCTTLQQPMSVSMVNVQFSNATVFESTAVFTLRINNENPEPLILEGGVHKIYLNGIYVGEGLSNQNLEVPRLSSAVQTVVVHLNNLRLATRIKPVIESQSFDYRISSVFYTSQPKTRSHVTSEGRLDLKDFQPTLITP